MCCLLLLDVGAGGVLDGRVLLAADARRVHLFAGAGLEPVGPVLPPGALVLGGVLPPPSLTQCLPLPLEGGLIMPAMWPLLAKAKRVVALVSCPIFHAEYHGTMWSLSAPTA